MHLLQASPPAGPKPDPRERVCSDDASVARSRARFVTPRTLGATRIAERVGRPMDESWRGGILPRVGGGGARDAARALPLASRAVRRAAA